MLHESVAETKFIDHKGSINVDKSHKHTNQKKTVFHHIKVKSITPSNDTNRDSESNVESATKANGVIVNTIKPVLWILKIFGLYYELPSHNYTVNIDHEDGTQTFISTDSQSHSKRGNKFIQGVVITPLRVYALAVCILLWFNAGRLMANLFIYSNSTWMAFVILYALWTYHVAGSATLLFYMCQYKLPIFFHRMRMVLEDESTEFLDCVARYTRKRTIIYLIPSSVFALFNSFFTIFFQFGPFDELRATMSVITSPFQNTTVFPYIYIFTIHFYCTVVWIYPVIMFCLCCLMVAKKFHILCKCFKKAINRGDINVAQIIMTYRKRYEAYCLTTESLSDAFSLYLAHVYATNLAIACFNLYRLLFNFADNGLLMNLTLVIWLVSTISLTVLISWVASILNKEVCDIL